MSKAAVKKRLDVIETNLTPKDWAIRLVDEMRTYESLTDFFTAMTMNPAGEAIWTKPCDILRQKVDENYPGRRPEYERKRKTEYFKLFREFGILRGLVKIVNKTMETKVEKAGMETAYRLQMLQTIILQDSFSRTAWKAASEIDEFQACYNGDEDSKQIMPDERSARCVGLEDEEGSSSISIGDIHLSFPSKVELWIDGMRGLIIDLYAHKTAIERIQDEVFDGHGILAKDIEEGIQKTIQTVEKGIDQYNEYLLVREKLFSAEWDADEAGDIPTGLSGEREGRLKIDRQRLKPVGVDRLVSIWKRDGEQEFIMLNNDILDDMDTGYIDRFFRMHFGFE